MERPLRPAGRLPRPARRPLGRLRATHQGPYRAREGTTRAENRHAHYVLTRVNHIAPVAVEACHTCIIHTNVTETCGASSVVQRPRETRCAGAVRSR